MTIERPMFPPRAESVDSFSHQPAPDHRLTGIATGDSPKPVRGLSRRLALAGLAMLPAVGIPATASADVPDPDPAFALIAKKLAADAAHCEAIDAQDAVEFGDDPDAKAEAWQRCCDACRVVNEADWRLATTVPTTLAGVAAVLRFANAIEDGGMEWPCTDTVGSEGWHYQLRATMAAAIEALIEAGKAVQS
jgi:hypothetical protein